MPEKSYLDVVQCRECGARQRVGPSARHRPCTSPTDARGFVIDRVEVLFLGRCPQCLSGSMGAPRLAQRATQPET